MDIFIGGVVVGLILGVWLSVAFFYFTLSRQKSGQQDNPPPPGQRVTGPAEINMGRPVEAPYDEDAQPGFFLHLDTPDTQDAYHRLLVMAHGDHALAERLIHYEWERRPNAPEVVLINNAIDRWIQDNR